jgi:nicotinamidase-related amidase
MDLLRAGYEVQVVTDAVSSRTPQNKKLALKRMREEGVKLTSTEMALFELTERAGTEQFRAISRLVK